MWINLILLTIYTFNGRTLFGVSVAFESMCLCVFVIGHNISRGTVLCKVYNTLYHCRIWRVRGLITFE